MTNPRSRNTGKTNRTIAFFITMAFHISLIGGLYYSADSENSFQDLLPDFVKEWFNGDDKPGDAGVKDRV